MRFLAALIAVAFFVGMILIGREAGPQSGAMAIYATLGSTVAFAAFTTVLCYEPKKKPHKS